MTSHDETNRLTLLEPHTGRARVVIDTDAYNEIDDQFAIMYALRSADRLDVQAIYAAPFFSDLAPKPRSTSPGDGMQKSYDEILRVLDLIEVPASGLVYRGSNQYLPDDETPAENSNAVDDLIARVKTSEQPVYVLAIGAITNIASALLRAPEITNRMVVVWLGGHAHWWPHTQEFNHAQDIPAVRVVFGSGVPLVHIPCLGVASHLTTTPAEMEQKVKGQGAIGDYLCQLVSDYEYRRGQAWSKVIWDIAAVAWMIQARWVPTQLVHAPIAQNDATWSFDKGRHFIRQAYWANRDAIFGDLFEKLAVTD